MDATALDQKIVDVIHAGVFNPTSDADFNTLALKLFSYQYQNNLPYHHYCDVLNLQPDKITHWKELPAVPTSAFKELDLCCFPVTEAVKTFYTSGTTVQLSGKHHLDSCTLYDASLAENFKLHLLPDKEHIRMLSLTPSPAESPHSSLVYMIQKVMELYGTPDSRYFIQDGILDIQGLITTIQSTSEPLLILGTAFSFVHLLDDCRDHLIQLPLNPESRIMETGGFKGKSREVSKSDLYAELCRLFNLPVTNIVNEYGMTELGTQFYDNRFCNLVNQKQHPSAKDIPAWSRIQIINPDTMEEMRDGEIGMIKIIDLSNRGSVLAIQTEDLGYKIGNGFEILGRITSATPRGCSLGIDVLLS
jgi:hypothetical protein